MNKLKTKLLFALLSISGLAYAASSFTTHYDLEKPAAGDVGWADALNSNADEIDAQMYINQQATQDHITDAVAAHAATAISTTEGSLVCTSAITTQAFLDCLDGQIGAITGGTVVTVDGDQDITGQKTFTQSIIAQGGIDATGTITFGDLSTGLLHADSGGELSSSLLVDADVSASAAIDYSKLDLVDSIVNADINSAAAIDYSKLALTGDIVNADINVSAGIATSKLGALTAGRAAVTDGSGFLSAATTTATEIGYVNGVTSAIQTQLDAKQATGNYVTALTGDVTATGPGSVAATIANNAVTNAKAATMPTLTIKGNNTGGTANALDLTVAQVNTMLGSYVSPLTTQGDLLYGGASGTPTRLAVGTASQVLRSNGTNPVWSAPEPTIAAKTGAYTLVANDNLITGDSSGGTFTLTLPAAAAGNTGKRYILKKTDTSFTAITITDGTLTTTLNTQNESVEVYSTGSAWLVLRRDIPSVWTTFTGAGTWSTNTSYTARWRRVGDTMEMQYNVFVSGAPNATNLLVNLPTGTTVDTAKLASTGTIGASQVQTLGWAQISDVGVRAFQGHATYSSTTNVAATYSDPAAAANSVTQASPFTWAANDSISLRIFVPITGWNG